MKTLLSGLTYLAALLALIPYLRPKDVSLAVLLWPLKVLAGALAPVLVAIGFLGTVQALVLRNWRLVSAGFLGVTAAIRFIQRVPDSRRAFAKAFGPKWDQPVPKPLRAPPSVPQQLQRASQPRQARWRRDVAWFTAGETATPLLADLWEPTPGVQRSKLGVVYLHGGGWCIGHKDMYTRPLFRGLAGQGHVIMDVEYTLWPQATIPEMVAQAKQAILWLKAQRHCYGVDPDRIVLMGNSAGGHLALLSAYTADHPAFPPATPDGDTTVCGVIAFYPPVDLLEMEARAQATYRYQEGRPIVRLLAQGVDAALDRRFQIHGEDVRAVTGEHDLTVRRLLPAIVGGEAGEIPEVYQLLSPSEHVGPHCPPTLLLLGSDDLFQLAPGVRRLHLSLRRAEVPAVLVEFPHADHAFDLVLPGLSPLAQTANSDVERFLALLAAGTARPDLQFSETEALYEETH